MPVALYLWVNVYGVILLSQFWSSANSASHPREAKRIFGIVGTGGIVGGLLGGILAAPLTHAWGVRGLLVLAALLLAAVAAILQALVMLLVRVGSRRVASTEEETPASDEPGANPLKHAYVRWLALAALCSVLVGTLLDYLFKLEIQRRFHTSHEIAAFIGLFYTATNLAALTLQLFFARWLLVRLGAGWTAAVLPAGLGLGAVLILAAPSFAAVITTRLWDQVMRISVNRSAVELFYFPLTPGIRRRAQTVIEAGLERIGDALAGLLILAAAATIGATAAPVASLVGARFGASSIMVPAGSVPANTLRLANSGMYLAIGSLGFHLPSSYSIIIATPVIGFVIE